MLAKSRSPQKRVQRNGNDLSAAAAAEAAREACDL